MGPAGAGDGQTMLERRVWNVSGEALIRVNDCVMGRGKVPESIAN
jgi:hypothetical protein